LHASNKTTIDGILKNGEITQMKVTPNERERNIVNKLIK